MSRTEPPRRYERVGSPAIVRAGQTSIRLHTLRASVAREGSSEMPFKPYVWGDSNPRLRPVIRFPETRK